MSGLPGTGKSTLSRLLARELGAVYLRIDTIESSLINLDMDVGHAGYGIAFNLAKDNLSLGLPVVADSVNPISETRALWRRVATDVSKPFYEVEVVCSNKIEHRERVERRRADYLETLKGEQRKWQPPAWQNVVDRDTEPWNTQPLIIDTAGQVVEESFQTLCALLNVTQHN